VPCRGRGNSDDACGVIVFHDCYVGSRLRADICGVFEGLHAGERISAVDLYARAQMPPCSDAVFEHGLSEYNDKSFSWAGFSEAWR